MSENNYTAKATKVTDDKGTTFIFKSRYQTCKELKLNMATLLNFINSGQKVARGKFKGWEFTTHTTGE